MLRSWRSDTAKRPSQPSDAPRSDHNETSGWVDVETPPNYTHLDESSILVEATLSLFNVQTGLCYSDKDV